MLPMHEALTRFMLAASAKASAWIDMRNAFTEQAQRATHETTRRQLTTFAARATMRADAIMAVVEMARKRDALRRAYQHSSHAIAFAMNADAFATALRNAKLPGTIGTIHGAKAHASHLGPYPQPFPNAEYKPVRTFQMVAKTPQGETVPAEYIAPDNPFDRMSQELFSAQFKVPTVGAELAAPTPLEWANSRGISESDAREAARNINVSGATWLSKTKDATTAQADQPNPTGKAA